MSNVKIELNSAGIQALLHSDGIKTALMEAGIRVQANAGDNFAAELVDMPTRSIVRVSAINKQGMKENSDDNVLLKALHGGG